MKQKQTWFLPGKDFFLRRNDDDIISLLIKNVKGAKILGNIMLLTSVLLLNSFQLDFMEKYENR